MISATYIQHFKKNLALAYPVMLSQLGQVLVGVADSVMVGRVGTEPLAAATLANAIFFVVLVFGIGVSYAITPLVAAADGEGNKERCTGVLRNALLLNTTLGIVLFITIALGAFILPYLDQPAEVVSLAIPYLNIITLSIIPFMLFQTFRQFAEGLSQTKQAMFVTIGANAINIGLNYLLIFGKGGFEPLGLNGAGYATLASRVIMAFAMGLLIYHSPTFRAYRLGFQLRNFSSKVLKRLLHVGIPAGLQFMAEVSAFGYAAIMVGWLGAQPLAAHQIAINLASISYMMATGIAAAATIRVGNQLGRQDMQALREAGFVSFVMSALFMGVAAIIFIVGQKFFPTLYVSDPEVIRIAAALIIVAAFFQISDGVQVVGMGALRGLTDVKMPTLIAILAYWMVGLPLGYWLGFKLGYGAVGIWYGLLAGLTVAAVLLLLRFNRLSLRLFGQQ